ncbi:ComEC/Rec2 family competence protein [Myxococcota bacterium]|nr:ComEC/Rec2 family competence protein [Myxococcota bacterium]MBU1382815.1 ComEC/Rec2 family competence protein [Myxococcota bacterium]MBU1497362.1 ComEC/Rec2 family competence protein [Myxococcota bacterium]
MIGLSLTVFLIGLTCFYTYWSIQSESNNNNIVISSYYNMGNWVVNTVEKTGIKKHSNYRCVKEGAVFDPQRDNFSSKCKKRQRVHPLKSMTWGGKPSIQSENLFRNLGISHLFAISGLHVAILITLVLLICRLLYIPLSFFIRIEKIYLELVVLIPAIWIYINQTGNSTGSIRAGIMGSAMIVLRRYYGLGTPLQFYFSAVLLIFISDPWCFYKIPFILSFSAVGMMLWTANSAKDFMGKYLMATVGATIGTAPFIFYFFNTVSPFSLYVNIIAVPIFTVIVIPAGIIVILISPLLVFPQEILKYLYTNIEIILTSIRMNLPEVGLLSGFTILIISTFSIYCGALLSGFRRWAIIITGIFVVIIISLHFRKSEFQGVVFFASKRGESSIITAKHNRIMVDIGSEYSVKWLIEKGFSSVRYLYLTHYHADHINSLKYLCNSVNVPVIFDNGNIQKRKHLKILCPESHFRTAPESLQVGHISINSINRSMWTHSLSENNNSLVLNVGLSGKSILFMGDLEVEAEGRLLNKIDKLNVDVLKAGHHGRKTSSGNVFRDNIIFKTEIITGNPEFHDKSKVEMEVDGKKIIYINNSSYYYKIR